jgi:DNA-binding FadR family transcriptional regulator
MAGVMVVLTARTRLYYKPETDQNYREHCQLVDFIAAGDAVKAGQLIEYQLKEATEKSVYTFHAQSVAGALDIGDE